VRDIRFTDPYASVTIRMCERHFSSYRAQMDGAAGGGTSYSFIKTNKRGCELCKKKNKDEDR